MKPAKPRCRYCDRRHPPDHLCPPARRILDALYARGMEFNMPTLEFPEPLRSDQLGLAPGDQLLQQLVVQAANVDVAGAPQPMVIFTGRAYDGTPLPQWMYPAGGDTLREAAQLVSDMVELAIREAARGRDDDVV